MLCWMFLVFILGFLPSTSGDFARDYRECKFLSFTQPWCPLFQKTMDCLKSIQPKYSIYEATIRAHIGEYQRILDVCPGLPEGSCYFGQMNRCFQKMNSNIYLSPDASMSLDKHSKISCSLLERYYEETMECFRHARSPCSTRAGQKQINRYIKHINKRRDECNNLDRDRECELQKGKVLPFCTVNSKCRHNITDHFEVV